MNIDWREEAERMMRMAKIAIEQRDALRAENARIAAQEREACAKLAEDGLYTDMNDEEMDLGPMIHVNPEIRRIVFRIRARGQQ